MVILFLAVEFVVNVVGFNMSEQELIFRMFACEFMGWYQSEKYEYYCFESSELMYRVCDALRCEE